MKQELMKEEQECWEMKDREFIDLEPVNKIKWYPDEFLEEYYENEPVKPEHDPELEYERLLGHAD